MRVVISGRVQGVWFRAKTQETAEQLGLAGWVRNLPSGSVEAVFEGEPLAVQAAVEWCHDGPDMARVDDVEATAEPTEGLVGFTVRG